MRISIEGPEMVCYNCQKTGHIKYDCPNLKVKMNQIRSPTKAYAEPEISAVEFEEIWRFLKNIIIEYYFD